MAEGLTQRNQVGMEMQRIKDRLTLDVLHEDAFSGETVDPAAAQQAEVNFYRGAPPQWLNFYLAEQNADEDDHPAHFIKRDGYDELREKILSKKSGKPISCVRFRHERGSGGSTLAMQLLWDLKKSFRCAVVVDRTPALETSLIASQVIELYTAGRLNHHKTVLLLVQDANVNALKYSVVTEMSNREIDSDEPIVVILNCVRMAFYNAGHPPGGVVIRKNLSAEEAGKFNGKLKWLVQKYSDKHAQLHGFNIMQSNFSPDYVKNACTVFEAKDFPDSNCGLKLTACMCLLNSYVSGSFFLKSRCEAFLKDGIQNCTFEETMKPFSHLMVSFSPHGSGEEHIRMAHPMIAEQGSALHGAAVDRSVTTLDLLRMLPEESDARTLNGFIKVLLTNRKSSQTNKPLLFSRLILDILGPTKAKKNKEKCVSVLKEAVRRFHNDDAFYQTLSRFYYLQSKDYHKAEECAKKIISKNSFFADTLGQVHKHHLNTLLNQHAPQTKLMGLAEKAFQAFQRAENLAEREPEERDGLLTNFNFRGTFAYVQVAKKLFDDKVIGRQTNKFAEIKDNIKKRAEFLNMLLTYSEADDPPYVLKDVRTCYTNYTGQTLPEGPGTGPTEDHLDILHQNWLKDTEESIEFDFEKAVKDMRTSYQNTYKKYLRSRYLLPLIYFRSRVHGKVHYYKVYTTVGGKEIQLDVDPCQRLLLWRSGSVSFKLGFTIRGPTAYKVKYSACTVHAY